MSVMLAKLVHTAGYVVRTTTRPAIMNTSRIIRDAKTLDRVISCTAHIRSLSYRLVLVTHMSSGAAQC